MRIIACVAVHKAKGEGSRGGVIVGRTKSGKAIYEAGHGHTSAAWKNDHGFSYNSDHSEAHAHHTKLAEMHNQKGDRFHATAERLAAVPKDHPALKGQDVKKDIKFLRTMADKHWKKATHHSTEASRHRQELGDRKERRKARKAAVKN